MLFRSQLTVSYRNHGSHFEKAKTAFEEGAANEGPILDDSAERVFSDTDSGNEKKGSEFVEKA